MTTTDTETRQHVDGHFTIGSATEHVMFAPEFGGFGTNPGGNKVGFSAKAEVDRNDFRWSWDPTLESKGVLVCDKVASNLAATAILQA